MYRTLTAINCRRVHREVPGTTASGPRPGRDCRPVWLLRYRCSHQPRCDLCGPTVATATRITMPMATGMWSRRLICAIPSRSRTGPVATLVAKTPEVVESFTKLKIASRAPVWSNFRPSCRANASSHVDWGALPQRRIAICDLSAFRREGATAELTNPSAGQLRLQPP
jgi:hypothetical protein